MGGSIEPFATRIGADSAEAVAVKSPFDFDRNMRVFVATDVPLPTPAEGLRRELVVAHRLLGQRRLVGPRR